MSEHELTIIERIKKYQWLISIGTGLVCGIASSAITLFTFSMNYGRALEQREQQTAKVATHQIRLDNQDTALANHRAIIYGVVFQRDNTRYNYTQGQ